MSPYLTLLWVALAAFGVGFASQRGSVCGVLAARQIVETGKTSRLVAFLTASMWALVVALPLGWLAPGTFKLGSSYAGIGLSVAGGVLYGIGTVANGACVFGTVSRVLSGNLSYLATLPGISLGAGLGVWSGFPQLRAVPTASPLLSPTLGAIALIVSIVAVGVATIDMIRRYRRADVTFRRAFGAARWRTSLAMMVIGILGGVLFATGSPWSYPSSLRIFGSIAFGRTVDLTAVSIIGPLALIAGGIVAAAAGGRFVWRRPRLAQATRSFVGGTMMGSAATLIPGGNDVLLLSALPSLALHGAIAYPAMLLTQLMLLFCAKLWKDRAARTQWPLPRSVPTDDAIVTYESRASPPTARLP